MDIFSFLVGDSNTSNSSEASKVREVEAVFYLEVKDPIKAMEKLGIVHTKEFHEQWEVKLDGHRIRTRKTTHYLPDGEKVNYELTKKIGGDEINEDATEFVYECFKDVATSGMIKDRFTLKVSDNPSVCFEFDFFIGPDGQYTPWCKVDLEIPLGGFSGDVPKIPEIYEDIILSKDESKKDIIDGLYDTYFITTK